MMDTLTEQIPGQLMINELPEGYLPCSNPRLVEGYVAIEEIFRGRTCDTCIYEYEDCGNAFCEHVQEEKRCEEPTPELTEHFRNGGCINIPITWRRGMMGNGHHRLVAAYDAGFTHVPYQTDGGVEWRDDYSEHYVSDKNFRFV